MAEAYPLSIDNTDSDEQTISVDNTTKNLKPRILPAAINDRANRAKLALPTWQKDINDIWSSIYNGKEDQVRQEAASFVDSNNSAARQKIIENMATKAGRPFNSEEVSYIYDLMRQPKENPETVFETNYSQQFLDTVARTGATDPDGWWNKMTDETKSQFLLSGRSWMSKQELLRTYEQDAASTVQQQSWPGYIADRLKGLVPFYDQFKLSPYKVPSVLSGTEAQEESKRIFGEMTFDEANKYIQQRYNRLKIDNPALAYDWVRSMQGLSREEETGKNIEGALNVGLNVGPIAGSLTKSIGGRFLKNAIKTATITASKEAPSEAAMAEAAGDVKEAAVKRVATDLTKGVTPEEDAYKYIASMYDAAITNIDRAPGNLSREGATRIKERLQTLKDDLTELYRNTPQIERLRLHEMALRNITAAYADQYPGLKNTLLDIAVEGDPSRPGENFVKFRLGNIKKDGLDMFSSESQAQKFINFQGLGNAKVVPNQTAITNTVQQGVKFYVENAVPFNETLPFVRQYLIDLPENRTPQGGMRGWLYAKIGKYITPEETLSKFNSDARHIAAYAPSNFINLAADTAKEYSQLKSWRIFSKDKRTKWNQFRQVLDNIESTPDSATGQTRRIINITPEQFEHAYQTSAANRLPDEQEIAAFFSHQREQLTLDVWNQLTANKEYNRIGAQKHTLTVPIRDVGKSSTIKQVQFFGVPQNTRPKAGESIYFVGDNAASTVVKTWNQLNKGLRSEMVEGLKTGEGKLIQVTDASDRSFQAAGLPIDPKTRIKWVYGKGIKSENIKYGELKLGRLPKTDYDNYIAQAIINRDPVSGLYYYEGDRIVMGHNISQLTRDVAKHLDDIRLALKDKDITRAQSIHAASKLPQEFSEIQKWFTPTVVRAERGRFKSVPSPLSLDEPIMHLDRNQTIGQADASGLRSRYGSSYRDGTIEAYGRSGKDRDPFDIFSLRNEGTRDNPIYKINPVEYLDPTTTLNRGLNKAANALFLDDYKAMSVEHWIREALPYLKNPKDAAVNVHSNFANPDWIPTTKSNIEAINNLKTANIQIQQFLGIKNENDTFLHGVAQKLTDSIYSKGLSPKLMRIPNRLLPFTRDPSGFVRSVVFDAKLGLFSVPQLWVQAQSFATIFGVAGPKFAAPGTKGMLLYQWSRLNNTPEIMARLDSLASKRLIPGTHTFRPGEFTEATQLGQSTGFFNVGRELVIRNDPFKYDIISDGTNKFLNAGRMFFNEGERSVRVGAWYTSYLEYRATNPTGTINQKALSTILSRADLLYANMSRASATNLQRGVFSVPLQFLSYQMRLSELALGKRLTGVERTRLFMTYAALYGVPGAAGLTGFPLGDWMKKEALEQNYYAGHNYITSALMEGIPAMLLALGTGNQYNYEGRYGVQGLQPLRDLFRGDRTWWDIFGGAAGSTLKEGYTNLEPFWHAMGMLIRQDGDFALKPEHFANLLTTGISSANSAKRLWMAFNTGKWMTKKEMPLTDVTAGNAAFMTLSGLSPLGQEVEQSMNWNRDTERQWQKEGISFFRTEFQRALRSLKDKDPQQANEYFRNALSYLVSHDIPEERYHEIFSDVVRDSGNQIDQAYWDYYTRKVPPSQKGVRNLGTLEQIMQSGNR